MKKQVFLLAIAWIGSYSLTAQRRLDLSGYVLTWSDEFNYGADYAYQMFDAPGALWIDSTVDRDPLVHSPDEKKQTTDPLPANGVYSRSRIAVRDGLLYLTAGKTPEPVQTDFKGHTYQATRTASWIMSRYNSDYYCHYSWDNHFLNPGFHYGIFEIRAKLPGNYGDESAFWFWNGYDPCGAPIDQFPYCHEDKQGHCTPEHPCPGYEIDDFESTMSCRGDSCTFHFFSSLQANALSQPEPCKNCATHYKWPDDDPTLAFHTYTLAWTPDAITWFIDGVEVRTTHNGIPPFKLNMILNCFTWGDQSSPLVVDYVRVYRPATVHYDLKKHPGIEGNYYWRDSTDPARKAYANAYSNTPYMTTENYKAKGISPVARPSTITAGCVSQDASATDYIYYKVKKDPRLYLVQTTADGKASSPISIAAGLPEHTSIASLWGVVFFTGKDKRLWAVRGRQNLSHLTYLADDTASVLLPEVPGDIEGPLLASAGGQSFAPPRIYYINNKHALAYYEWCEDAGDWKHFTTPVSGVQKSLTVATDGKLYYIGTDGKIWVVQPDFGCTRNMPTDKDWPHHCIMNEEQGAPRSRCQSIAVADNDHIFFTQPYRDRYRLYCLNKAGTVSSTDITDIGGNLMARKLPNGCIEVVYRSYRNRIKTYYQRQLSSDAGYQSVALDVFTGGEVQDFLWMSPGNHGGLYCSPATDAHATPSFQFTSYQWQTCTPFPPNPFAECTESSAPIALGLVEAGNADTLLASNGGFWKRLKRWLGW